VDRRRFEELVADALDALPQWVLDLMDNVEVLVEDRPPPGESNLLGQYHGVPLTARGEFSSGARLPDTITLFKSTIERVAGGDEERVRDVVIHTVEHEVAHFFGISDDRLRELDAY
jgi:predicted Zn-dependent protease with MMP-like domain